jgi:hypothetical protein
MDYSCTWPSFVWVLVKVPSWYFARSSLVPMARMDRNTCIYVSRRSVIYCSHMMFRDIASELPYHIAILMLRIYALYSLNKKLLTVMLIFYFACSACSAWIIITALSSISSMDSSDEQFFKKILDLIYFFFFLSTSYSTEPPRPRRWRFLLNPLSSSWNLQILDSHAVVRMSSLRSGNLPRISEI